MGFLSKLSDPLGIGEKTGISEGLADAGLGAADPFANPLTAALDPGDLAGTVRAKDAKRASQAAEAQELSALQEAQEELRRATGEAQGFLSPFAGVGEQGLDLAGFLTDPTQQRSFLESNPLFQLGLQNLNQQTQRSAASRGRLTAGDTLQQLQQNATLAGQPLIQEQKRSIIDLLNFGSGTSRAQANAALGLGSDIAGLIQDRGNVQASGIAGRNQIRADTTANQNQLAGTIFEAFSDPKLKTNKKITGTKNGYTLWSWTWNKLANELGLSGDSTGVMADEVLRRNPDAITYENGFMKVNYSMIGVI